MNKKASLGKLVYLCIAGILLGAIFLAACSSSTTSTTPATSKPATSTPTTSTAPASPQIQTGGTFKIGMDRDAVFLGDPIEITQQQDTLMSRPAIETLARYNSSGELVPWLATGWKTDADTLTMTVTLRKGVKFHDGTDFNAAAVKFNLDRFRASKRSELALVNSVDVVDDYSVKIGLTRWDSTIEGGVLYFAGNMISPKAFESNGKEWVEKNPVGTGPFKFVSWERDVSLKYEKNPDYWQKGKPYLDKIEFSIIADPMVRLAALDRREVDLLERPDAKDIAMLKAAGKYIVVDLTYSGLGLNTLVPDANHADSPFANYLVRQAVAYAIDKQALVDTILSGHGLVATQYAEPNSWAYNPEVKGYPYDVNKAKQLLSEAGYPNGFECKIYGKNDAQTVLVITAFQGYFAKIGITAEVVPMSATMFNDIAGDTGWTNAVAFLGLRGGPDPAALIPRYYGPKGKPAWLTSVLHPDEALQAMNGAISARDLDTKKAEMYKLQSILFDKDLVSIPVYHSTRSLVKYPNVHGDSMYLADESVWTPEDAWISK